ncbi:hypothetical protein ALC62_09291 [Cyphomyrmex costatus]|uniref:DUF4817 domain-containing protein n=1 Tax=Cyphomyrmex costatus TaxID=456900 RepID=A0A151IFN9_9HYME|nr:hypothetical protein ALC62_09291 [Cyphomyrmex costatus]
MRYTAVEYADILITYGLAGENANVAAQIYAERFPRCARHPTRCQILRVVRRGCLIHDQRLAGAPVRRRARREEEILDAFYDDPGTSLRNAAHDFGVSLYEVHRVVIGPFFLPPRLNGEIYADFLRNELPVLLADVPLYVRAQMIYQHDGAPAHFRRDVRDILNTRYRDRWIGSLALAVILFQKQESGKLAPIAYYSQATNSAETKYHSFELEMLAVVKAVERFHSFTVWNSQL